MVDLSAENKALCFKDSVEKPITVAIYDLVDNPDIEGDTYYKIVKRITGGQIISESMKFNEGVIDSNTFEFGTFVLPQMSIQWRYEGERYLGKYCTVYQKIGTEYIVYMTGTITQERFTNNRQAISATISSLLSERLNSNCASVYNGYAVGTEITFADFIGILIGSDVAPFFLDIEKTKLNFPFFGVGKFKIISGIERILISELLNFVGNALGAHIKIAKHKFADETEFVNTPQLFFTDEIEFIRINNVIDLVYPSQTLYPSSNLFPLLLKIPKNPIYELPYYISVNYDDLQNTAYACYRVKRLSNETGSTVASWQNMWANPAGQFNATPTYEFDMTICDNAFASLFWSGTSGTESSFIYQVIRKICPYLLNSKYVVGTLDYTYAPFLEPGDNIRVTTTDGRTIIIPILNCSVSGINALRATVSSEITSN